MSRNFGFSDTTKERQLAEQKFREIDLKRLYYELLKLTYTPHRKHKIVMSYRPDHDHFEIGIQPVNLPCWTCGFHPDDPPTGGSICEDCYEGAFES